MKIKLFFYVTILLVLFPRSVHAYLDPGTGSYLFQILIAGTLGSLFFVKSIFRRIKGFFGRDPKKLQVKKVNKIDENK